MTEERRLAAIMFADVCDYSTLMGEDEGRALAVVEMAVACIESASRQYGGRVIKKLGDGVLCEFPSAVNAVRCAIEVQKAVSEHDATAEPSQRFQMRIGIHVGDVVVSGDDILGDGVNVASRIEPLAEPGGICISRDVFDLVKNKVSIETVNLGPHDLKNISRQIDIYKVLIDAVAGYKPAVKRTGYKWSAKMTSILAIVGLLAALAVVAAGARLLVKGARTNRAKREFAVLAGDARRLAQDGKAREALGKLKAAADRFRGTRCEAPLNELLAQIESRETREVLTARQQQFLKAVANDDRAGAFRLVDPKSFETTDPGALWIKLRMMAAVLKAVDVGADNFRIDKIEFTEDRQTASVWMKIFRKTPANPEGAWRDIPPSEWRLMDGQWYLRAEPRRSPPLPDGREPRPRPYARP